MTTDYLPRFKELSSKSIKDQAKVFLTAFVLEFQGNFEEVLELGEEFRKYGPAPEEGKELCELEADRAHYFLEKHGDARTVKQLRDEMKQIDLDANSRISFIEFLLWRYKKSLALLFATGGADPALIKQLEEAIEAFEKVLEFRRDREKKMKNLEEVAAKGGVKGLAASNELEQMKKEDQLAQNKKELTAAALKRKAEKAVKSGDGREKALKEEQERLEKEQKRKEEEERKKREDARGRLKAKASLFEGKTDS